VPDNLSRRFKFVAIAVAAVAPAVSFAQSSNVPPLTRSQVNRQLVQLERAGYKPSKTRYPADLQAAEARVDSQGDAMTTAAASVGGSSGGSSQSGFSVSTSDWHSLYRHH